MKTVVIGDTGNGQCMIILNYFPCCNIMFINNVFK